jgi:imidazolonepropionase-like amidohydrolase
MTSVDLIIKNASELLTLSVSSKEESGLGLVQTGTVAIKEGRILWVGKEDDVPKDFVLEREGNEIDASGKVVMPGREETGPDAIQRNYHHRGQEWLWPFT